MLIKGFGKLVEFKKKKLLCINICFYLNNLILCRALYIPSEAYAQSKLAQIMFSNALDRRLKEENAKVLSISVHPGVVDTQLFDGTFLKKVAPWIPKLLFKVTLDFIVYIE